MGEDGDYESLTELDGSVLEYEGVGGRGRGGGGGGGIARRRRGHFHCFFMMFACNDLLES